MPYQDLPDNFEKDYHSVWVDAPNALFNPEKAEHMYKISWTNWNTPRPWDLMRSALMNTMVTPMD